MQQDKKLASRIPLGPRSRAVAVFAIVAVVVFGALTAMGETGPINILFSAWFGLFVVFILYRRSFFAEMVPLRLPGTSEPYIERMRRTTGRHRSQAGSEATFLALNEADEADDEVEAEDRVIGIEVNGHAIAYPLAAIGPREIAHEVFGRQHVFVTWWPVTYSARAFVIEPSDRSEPDLIGIRKTVLNSAVMLDRTGSEIIQFIGHAVTGPLAGQTLKQVPVVSTNWRAWSTAFPHTEVMSLDGTVGVDTFEKYYVTNRAGLYQQPAKDRRWHDKDNVLGVEVNGEARAYPYPALIEQPLIHEELGREPILIAHERLTATAVPFSRVVDGRTLTFSGDSKNPRRPMSDPGEPVTTDIRRRINYEPWFLVDDQTGSRWRAVSGECVSGELAGKRLRMLNGQSGFWFAWSRFYPNATVLESTRSGGDPDR